MITELLSNKPNKKAILLGNEAAIRGALEAGVQFVSTYPGTPASEIGNIFYEIQNSKDKIQSLYFEFSVNEKVAMDAAAGASYSGLKTMVAMKNFGLNVASDALLPFVYTGSVGPTVVFIADDPSCYSSAQTEENTRAFASLSHIPILEPSDPQECKDFIKLAFQISEKYNIPVMVRTTTRVSHQKMPVVLGKLAVSKSASIGKFIKDPHRFITMPPRVLEMKDELLAKIAKIQVLGEAGMGSTAFNSAKKSDVGVITSGVSHLYAMEAMKDLEVSLPVLKINFFHPLPEKKIQAFIKKYKKVLVVEELEPYIEKEVSRLAKDINCKIQIIGKELLPETGEMKPEFVASALAKLTNKKYGGAVKYSVPVSQRSPILCPSCPYWSVISAVKSSVDVKEVVFGGEIGCYMLFGNEAIALQDYLSCMGSSVGIGHGINKASGGKQKLIAFEGDSSFFHAGIPALINTVFNKSNPLIIILNNQTTAMTGNQPHPASINVPEPLNIEAIVKACGVKYTKTVDPKNREEFTQTIKDFLTKDEVSVIVAQHPCIFAVKKI